MMRHFMASILVLALLVCFVLPALAENSAETKTIRIIGTSDLHGKFMPWDYALNAASPSGSMTQQPPRSRGIAPGRPCWWTPAIPSRTIPPTFSSAMVKRTP